MKKNFYISYYCGPGIDYYTNRRQEMVDCGFNLLQIERGDIEQKKDLLRYCEKNGLVGCVHSEVSGFLYTAEWRKHLEDPSAVEAAVKRTCEEFRDMPAVYSYYLIDEPEADKFPLIGKIIEYFRKYDPDHICYVNLFPNYATPEQLGAPTYEDYLRQFVEIAKPDLLSYDHYHFKTDNRPDEDITITDEKTAREYAANLNRIDEKGFFNNLEVLRKVAQEYNIPYMTIVLLTEHGAFRYLLPEEISFEVYQNLVYGCCAVSYFRYWASENRPYPYWRDQNSIVSDDIVCQHYYDVQAINAEVMGIGKCIAATESKAVFHVGEEVDAVQFFNGYEDVRDIRGGRYSIGFFADGSFLIANKDYLQPSTCVVDTDAILEIFDNKTCTFVPTTEKQFTIPAGSGVYLRKV